jgi:hypothetical protein
VSYRVADLATRSLAFEDADEAWFAPLAARLASGEIAEARLHVGSSEYRLRGRQRWRLWVRPRPWWELAA